MKNKFLHLFSIFLLFTGIFYISCADKPSQINITPAEPVTLIQVQNSFPAPDGTGTLPSNKIQAMEVITKIRSIEGDCFNLIDEPIIIEPTKLRKRLKNYTIKKIREIRKEITTESDSGSLDQEGTIDLSTASITMTGTVDYNTSGSYSWTESDGSTDGLYNSSNQLNVQQYSKYKFNNVLTSGSDIKINGFLNQNTKIYNKDSFVYDYLNDVYKSISIEISGFLSYSNGYAISGSIYTGYYTVFCDLSISLNKTFSEEELASVIFDDETDETDININDYLTVTGSMTVTFYNATGETVFNTTLTAEDLKSMEK